MSVTESHASILLGMAAKQKHISSKYFYDERGSRLFDQICELPEYYVTRAELKLMDSHFTELSGLVGSKAAIIEFGAGSNIKIRKLLDHLDDPVAYVPVDISHDYLLKQAIELAQDFPTVNVQPVFADFAQPFKLPRHPVMPERNLIFFPGSTIGNFTPDQARKLLEVMRFEARRGGALLIGVDLRKSPALLHSAYNDSQGVTAEFNLNVLRRLNTELEGNFNLANFFHHAIYDEYRGCVEMRLVSRQSQTVLLAGQEISFAANEYIITEYSYKYSVAGFQELACSAGFEPVKYWVDEDRLFSMHYLTVV